MFDDHYSRYGAEEKTCRNQQKDELSSLADCWAIKEKATHQSTKRSPC
jgi:phosphopantetheinyl transferase (holo-ACP synthase)